MIPCTDRGDADLELCRRQLARPLASWGTWCERPNGLDQLLGAYQDYPDTRHKTWAASITAKPA